MLRSAEGQLNTLVNRACLASRNAHAPTASCRALRGGSWNFFAALCRCAVRYRSRPAGRSSDIGFRVAVGTE